MADIGQEKDSAAEQEEVLETEPVTEQEDALEAKSAAEQEEVLEAEQDDALEAEPVADQEEAPQTEPDNESNDNERKPRPLTQKEYIREQIRLSRLEWLNEHKTLIFVAVGIVLALLIFLGIRVFNSSNNPATWLIQSCVKDFGTSFDFSVTLSEGGVPAMKYDGSIDCDRSARTVEALYEADYGSYTFTGALSAKNGKAVKGAYINDKWTVEDCSEKVRDFFSLDKSLKNGDLDAGALLRFLGMTSDFSSEEVDRFSKRLAGLLSSDSTLVTVAAESVEGGTRYSYEISVGELFRILAEDGAPLFFHSSDYNDFKDRYMANKRTLDKKMCKMNYVIDSKGYLAAFDFEINADDILYKLDCSMSNFGEAEVELPAGFLEAAGLTETE